MLNVQCSLSSREYLIKSIPVYGYFRENCGGKEKGD